MSVKVECPRCRRSITAQRFTVYPRRHKDNDGQWCSGRLDGPVLDVHHTEGGVTTNEPRHGPNCEAEFISGPMLWTACSCADRDAMRTAAEHMDAHRVAEQENP